MQAHGHLLHNENFFQSAGYTITSCMKKFHDLLWYTSVLRLFRKCGHSKQSYGYIMHEKFHDLLIYSVVCWSNICIRNRFLYRHFSGQICLAVMCISQPVRRLGSKNLPKN